MGGGGSTYDYGFRIYNPALAKFLSVDPLSPDYPELTPYQFASNDAIRNIDIDGLEGGSAIEYMFNELGKSVETQYENLKTTYQNVETTMKKTVSDTYDATEKKAKELTAATTKKAGEIVDATAAAFTRKNIGGAVEDVGGFVSKGGKVVKGVGTTHVVVGVVVLQPEIVAYGAAQVAVGGGIDVGGSATTIVGQCIAGNYPGAGKNIVATSLGQGTSYIMKNTGVPEVVAEISGDIVEAIVTESLESKPIDRSKYCYPTTSVDR